MRKYGWPCNRAMNFCPTTPVQPRMATGMDRVAEEPPSVVMAAARSRGAERTSLARRTIASISTTRKSAAARTLAPTKGHGAASVLLVESYELWTVADSQESQRKAELRMLRPTARCRELNGSMMLLLFDVVLCSPSFHPNLVAVNSYPSSNAMLLRYDAMFRLTPLPALPRPLFGKHMAYSIHSGLSLLSFRRRPAVFCPCVVCALQCARGCCDVCGE